MRLDSQSSWYVAYEWSQPDDVRSMRSVSRRTALSPYPTISDLTRTTDAVAEPHERTVSFHSPQYGSLKVVVVSKSPVSLSTTPHTPSACAYETSLIRLPPALNFLKRIALPERVISHERSFAPEAVKVAARRTPSVMFETTIVRPPRSDEVTVRTPHDVVSVTLASLRARSENDCGVGVNGSSRSNHRNPVTCRSSGMPRAMRKRTEPTDGPSSASQLPESQALQPPHGSAER